MDGSVDILGATPPASPVVVSVPHAGRDYPLALRTALRVPLDALVPLEDRRVDAIALAARSRQTMLIAQRARAWIDLNRAEHERDPRVDEGASPLAQPAQSAKLRSGLGLVPSRVGRTGDLWRRRFADAEIAARIAADHRPYHVALGRALAAARERFGIAVLVDLHSMPPLGSDARIVLGDRFGRSAAARFVARLEGEAARRGIATALNSPYAGGHILNAHADPANGLHAVQVEIDRTLYLDRALDAIGPGFTTTVDLLRRMLAAVEDEALGGSLAHAAE